MDAILEPCLLIEGEYVPLSRLDLSQTQELLELLNQKWSVASTLRDQSHARQFNQWIESCYDRIDFLEYQKDTAPPVETDPGEQRKVDKKQRKRFGVIKE